jgi:hypothetical protein
MFKKKIEHQDLSLFFIEGDRRKFSASLDQIKAIYFNKIDRYYPELPKPNPEDGEWLGISYEINEHGFRSPSFDKKADILILGCSQTFGIGIENIENTWPAILSDKLNLPYASLAKSGSSINSQIRRAYAYIKQYGKPKYIYAIFPDFDRLEFPVDQKVLMPDKRKDRLNYLETIHKKNQDEVLKFSSAPHDARDVIPPSFRNFFSAQYILMFEQYCQEAGINLVWSTWSINDQALISKLKELDNSAYTSFIELDEYRWTRNQEFKIEEYRNFSFQNNTEVIHCHKNFEHLRDFHIALDAQAGLQRAHSGVHHHLHWAEIMYSHAIKNKWI